MYAYIPSRLGLPPTPTPTPRKKGPLARRRKASVELGCRAQSFSQPPRGWVAEVDMVLGEWLAKESCHVSWDGVPLC